jgi:hypothetical protein
MAKLKLVANPTFKAKVEIPVAGGDPVPVEFIFKHRTKTALEEFVKTRTGKSDAESFMEMVEGWELDDPFNKESVELLCDNYIGAGLETYRVYLDQLMQAPSAAEAAAFGLTLEEASGPSVEVWPDNWPAIRLFDSLSTQWRTGAAGVIGLDYNVLYRKMDRLHLAESDYDALEENMRILEDEALATMRKK